MAREQGRLSQELFELHALDGFLARLAVSESREQLVLKGGVLLAAFDLRRPTRDVDLQAQGLSNDADTVLALVRRVVALPGGDGLAFDPASARARVIRDADAYTGVRVSLTAHLASARIASTSTSASGTR